MSTLRSATSSRPKTGLAAAVIRFVRAAAAAAVFPAFLSSAPPQVVDCVAAHVNRRAITLTDLRVLRTFHLQEASAPGAAEPPPELSLRQAIDRQVVVDFMREKFPVPREEIEARLAAMKARHEPDDWQRLLDEFGITESDLASYLENILQFERMVAIRFGRPPDVTVREMEDYYRREYAPGQKAAGLEPQPLSQVAGEIEERLRDRKRQSEISEWIQGLRAQAEIKIHEECLRNLK